MTSFTHVGNSLGESGGVQATTLQSCTTGQYRQINYLDL